MTVRINDRGPFIGGRIIDLSRGARRVIGMDGLAPVCLAVLGRGTTRVASIEEGEQRYVRRRARTRSVASLDGSRMERPGLRSESHGNRRHAKGMRHHRHGLAATQHARRTARIVELEGRRSTRQARRAEQREERRMRREASQWSAYEAGL